MDAGRVSAGPKDARQDGVLGVVFEGDVDGREGVAQGLSGGCETANRATRGKVEQDRGFAQTGIAIEDRDLAQRDVAAPQPVDRPGPYLREIDRFEGFGQRHDGLDGHDAVLSGLRDTRKHLAGCGTVTEALEAAHPTSTLCRPTGSSITRRRVV